MKWSELTPEQRGKVIDYDVSAECMRDDVDYMEERFRESLKKGEDAVWIRYAEMVEWWNGMDEEDQAVILEEE